MKLRRDLYRNECLLLMLWTAPPRRVSAMDVGAVKAPTIPRSRAMQVITKIGLDIAKSVFQVYCVDAKGMLLSAVS